MKIQVKVIPNSKVPLVEKLDEGNYRIKVDGPAKEGKANKRLVEILSEYFNVPKSSIEILHGHNGRNKVINIL